MILYSDANYGRDRLTKVSSRFVDTLLIRFVLSTIFFSFFVDEIYFPFSSTCFIFPFGRQDFFLVSPTLSMQKYFVKRKNNNLLEIIFVTRETRVTTKTKKKSSSSSSSIDNTVVISSQLYCKFSESIRPMTINLLHDDPLNPFFFVLLISYISWFHLDYFLPLTLFNLDILFRVSLLEVYGEIVQ